MTFVYEFDGKNICVDHLLNPGYIMHVTLVEGLHKEIGINSIKLNFPKLPRYCPIGPYFHVNDIDI